MNDYCVEARYEQSMAEVFAMLAAELGARRWLSAEQGASEIKLPRTGLRFGYRQAQRLYSGQVLECLRPVSFVLVERYAGPASRIIARQHWQLEPLDQRTRLRGTLRLEANRFARLQLRFWTRHFAGRLRHTCTSVQLRLNPASPQRKFTNGGLPHSGSIGQNSGSASIVSANTSSVKGSPIRR